MAYVVPIHRPGSVRHALKLNFLEAERECLVVAKANRIEIHKPTAEGLILRHTRALYGAVTLLAKLRPASSPTDHLFVGTDRHVYFTVSWDAAAKQLRTETSMVDLADPAHRDSQAADRCAIDPTCRCLTLELFEGILTVVPIVPSDGKRGKSAAAPAGGSPAGALAEPIPVRIAELFIRSWAFLHPRPAPPSGGKKQKGPKGPRIALLYDDSRGKVRLRVKELEHTPGFDAADFVDAEPAQRDVDQSASHVIPVPGPAYGLLVLAETSVTYVDEMSAAALRETLQEPAVWATWTAIDDRRWLLGDDYGRLFFLMLVTSESGEVKGFKIDNLGITARASAMVYLDSGYVFIGSHHGDSQVIKIETKSLSVIQTMSNISPVLDFSIMDMGNRDDDSQTNEYSSGQARIVTGSGIFQDGSLRSVRSGVGIEELGSLGDMPNVTQLFSLSSTASDEWVDMLMVSFIDETRLFRLDDDGDIEELQSCLGLVLSETTILAKNFGDSFIIQCTSNSVRLIDVESDMVTASWSSESGAIMAASANDREIALSVSGTELVVLDMTADLRLISRKRFPAGREISCIAVPDLLSTVCIVGFWGTAEVAILRTDSLYTIHETSVSEDPAAVPRSVLLAQMLPDEPPTLFVALADGNVVTFDMQPSSYALKNRKSTILGTRQANLKVLPREDGLSNVFATCEHPSLIYGSEGRIFYSAVNVEKAAHVCNFNAEAYPGAIAIATTDELKLALVDPERTTHVQKLHVGESVRRIAYAPRLKAFGMGTVTRKLEQGAEIVQGHFKIADEVVFRELDAYDLKDDELMECVVRADVQDSLQGRAERFLVGTSYITDEADAAKGGRILVFEVTQDRSLSLVSELGVRSGCRALATLQGKIVAALNRTVVIYELENGQLEKHATFRTSCMPIDICVSNDEFVAVADIMKSVSITRYTPGPRPCERGTLTEVARHFHTGWSTAVAPVDDETWLLADAEGNLTVLRRNANGVTADDRRRLETTSEMRLGEMVNKIRAAHVPATPAAVVLPRAFMGTTEGSIYLFALIKQDKQDLLMRLQQNIAACVRSPGHVPFSKYRAYKNTVRESAEPFRFVDGELIERFLDCPPDLQEEMVSGLGVEVGEVRGMIESLRRIH